jgi:transposase-like protein
MSKRPRRNHSAAFKAKVAIEALADGKTIAEIAQKHDVHPNQVTEWRRQLMERAAGVFGSITMEADFYVEALRAAARWGAPQIVNTDQGNRFSSAEFVAEV